MKTSILIKRLLSATILLSVAATNGLAKEKKGFALPDPGIKNNTSTTVKSKYNFTYNVIPGMKVPAAGSNAKNAKNPINLTMNKENTIVTDHNTKLQWTSRTLLIWINMTKAKEYCSNLRTGGYDDWRLPTIKEIVSVADYDTFEPTFSSKYFPGVPVRPSGYWAVPEGTGNEYFGWHIGFDGHVMGQPKDATKLTRCVRADNLGAFDKNNFVDNKNGTVTATATSLVWQQPLDDTKRDYKTSVKYCKNLNLAGRDDWRLPSFKELISAVDYHTFRPAAEEKYLKNIKQDFYWSSSLDPAFGTDTVSGVLGSMDGVPRAWAVEFLSGSAWKYKVTDKYPTMCVTDKK